MDGFEAFQAGEGMFKLARPPGYSVCVWTTSRCPASLTKSVRR